MKTMSQCGLVALNRGKQGVLNPERLVDGVRFDLSLVV